MAQPSSSHHGDRERERPHRSDRDRERERSERSHHHHRTISSTTLLLVLSLVLAVLAVMLSLPSSQSGSSTEGTGTGVLGYLTPKRTQALIARESAVAVREAEVARREAELLAGAPGGVVPAPSPVLCPPCAMATTTEIVPGPIQTIIKEIVKEDSLTPPGWTSPRAEEILERELKIAEREREIGKREESVNRREHDASRREAWIMEQLHFLGNDNPQHVDDEYVYEQPVPVPPVPKRKAPKYQELPPIIAETEIRTVVQTQTVTVPPPANTRLAHIPKPEGVSIPSTPSSPRTTAVEILADDEDEDDGIHVRTAVRKPRPTQRPPSRWFGGW